MLTKENNLKFFNASKYVDYGVMYISTKNRKTIITGDLPAKLTTLTHL